MVSPDFKPNNSEDLNIGSVISKIKDFDNNVFKVADDVQEPITFKATSSLSRVDGHQIL